jgi:acetyl coenzyme A synthetase (ADP forming)-like protein
MTATGRDIVARALKEGRRSLRPSEARDLCEAYGIPVPGDALATSAEEAGRLASELGFPVVLKVMSPQILHKTEAGGVRVGLTNRADVEQAYCEIVESAAAARPDSTIDGVQIQQQVEGGHEVIVGSVTDASFGKLVAFGLGGVLVELFKDVTFRLAPLADGEARSMLTSIRGAEMLEGFRGAEPADTEALVSVIEAVSRLASEIPEIDELDLNPVVVRPRGAVAVDVRVTMRSEPRPEPFRPPADEILAAMNRIMKPRAVAVIGASSEDGKIGNSVMKNLINGGFAGNIHPVHPKADEILGCTAYRSVLDIPGDVDVAIFAIPARFVAATLAEVGEKGIPAAIMIPSGFAEVGEVELQREMLEAARKHNVRVMGPNIYGYYYTPSNLCATFCTPYDLKGSVALSSQSGGVGMSIIGFSRSTGMGVSAIVGLGNKADLDEDDLLTYFEQDDDTQVIAMHVEDLKDGRSFAEVAKRVSRTKPVIVLKAGRTALGARASASHTGALAGNDKVYDDVLRTNGVIRARSLNELLQFARALPVLPTPKGENVVIITGAGGSGVLLSDACVDNGLELMAIPDDLDAAFRKFIPPFGAAGNPIDITGGEPPTTYQNTIKLGLHDDRIHSLVLGYWHTIITPPLVFADLVVEVVSAARTRGIDKPIVASLVGDTDVERASEILFEHGIPAYPYTTELPVDVLGAKYRWARGAGLI